MHFVSDWNLHPHVNKELRYWDIAVKAMGDNPYSAEGCKRRYICQRGLCAGLVGLLLSTRANPQVLILSIPIQISLMIHPGEDYTLGLQFPLPQGVKDSIQSKQWSITKQMVEYLVFKSVVNSTIVYLNAEEKKPITCVCGNVLRSKISKLFSVDLKTWKSDSGSIMVERLTMRLRHLLITWFIEHKAFPK